MSVVVETIISPKTVVNQQIKKIDNLLQSSPYEEEEHLLNLSNLNYEDFQLAIALNKYFEPILDNYQTENYENSFPFQKIVNSLPKDFKNSSYYVVAFRSRLFPYIRTSKNHIDTLMSLDKISHEEANKTNGLLKYWFQSPDANGNNLATCIWRSVEDAKIAGKGKQHRIAAQTVNSWYENWYIERFMLKITDSAQSWSLQRLPSIHTG